MIRLAVSRDVPRLVEMGLRFRRESEYNQHLSENAEKMAELAGRLAADDCLLVSEREGLLVGMLGYVLFPHFLSGELVAGEVFWWVEPGFRGEGLKLLRAAETRSRAAGAKYLQMIAPNDRVAAVYKRLDYSFVEAAYQKLL